MTEFVAKLRVIFTAAVTYLTLGVTIVTIFAEEIAAMLPVGAAEDLTQWALIAVGWLTAAITIIRRVSPVLPDERGILPQS